MAIASGLNLLLLVLVFLPSHGTAQSLDDCMQSRGQHAISVCKQLLDNGSRNPTIYYKLASEHYQANNNETAQKVIDQGLALHPSDKDLKRLKEYVAIGTQEQRDIAKSTEKNQQRIKLGQLKITCRTKKGDVGISACKEYLSLTSADKGVIEKRLATLQPQGQETTVATTQIAPVEVTPETTQIAVAEPATNPTVASTSEPSAEKRARRKLVSQVQSTLNNLGFDAGSPDGISGGKTRRALAQFYQNTGFQARTRIDQTTLATLENASNDKYIADKLFEQSLAARDAGDIALAIQRMEDAEATSSLIYISENYRSELAALQLVAKAETQTEASPTETVASNQAVETNTAAESESSSVVNALVAQLQTLELKLQSHESTLRKSLGAIRAAGAAVR